MDVLICERGMRKVRRVEILLRGLMVFFSFATLLQ